MNSRILTARIVHDLSLSSWFGGELMGAVSLNGAAAQLSDPRQRSRAAGAGWRRFSPVLLGSVAAHLVSGSVLVKEDRNRLKTQQGFARASAIKTALTSAALAGTACQQVLGLRMAKGADQTVIGATQPAADTAPAQTSAQRQLNALQFVIPALTGSAPSATSLSPSPAPQPPPPPAPIALGSDVSPATGLLSPAGASSAFAGSTPPVGSTPPADLGTET